VALFFAALLVSAAISWGAFQVARELRAAREERVQARALAIVKLFAPATIAVQNDPRALLVWQPLARMLRQLFPVECASLDRAAGGAFPFGRESLTAAHARWTTEWLSWERTHDAEYKLKAAVAQAEMAVTGEAVGHARLDAVELEKLTLYQRRYEEYVQVAKALHSLATPSSTSSATAAASTAPERKDLLH
jgi:hypothetical protein